MKDLLYPLRSFHGKIYGFPLYRNIQKIFVKKFIHSIENKLKENPRTVFLVMTPQHGNLGDHAIAFAETTMLEEEKNPYIELSDAQLHHLQAHNFFNVMNGHTILITGGGNLGTLWPEVEKLQREIILGNPDSNILILPNTIYYGKTENDKEQLQESMSIYNEHSNLYLYAREKISYDRMKECYRNVKLVPDMMLDLNKSNSFKERKGCIFMLRKDCEKTISKEATMKMIKEAKKFLEIILLSVIR